MDFLKDVFDLFLHIDKHLNEVISQYGTLTYAILFAIIFVETGLVIMPFLPGDSLLFAAGLFAAQPGNPLNVWVMLVLLFVAAVLGDTVNYSIGKFMGPKVFSRDYRLIKREHLIKTQSFFEKYGGKTIIIARFVPIVRTFAPFVAGIGTMNYSRFILFNLVGGGLWVGLFLLLGYLFGNIPVVRDNFKVVTLGIIVLSILPIIIEWVKSKAKPAAHA